MYLFSITDKTRVKGGGPGRKTEGVGVMKDKKHRTVFRTYEPIHLCTFVSEELT